MTSSPPPPSSAPVPGSNLAPGTGPEVNPTAETPGSPTPTPAAAAAAEPEPAVSLAPHYGLPLAVTLAGALCLPLQPSWGGFRWLAIALVAFGGFLLLQARLLRLEFTGDGLVVWRGASVIRQFPYATWLGWRLFWPRLPVLFYFREERSIHLLPVLFDGAGLRQQLERRLAFLAPPPAP